MDVNVKKTEAKVKRVAAKATTEYRSFLRRNWMYIGIGVGVLVVVMAVIGS